MNISTVSHWQFWIDRGGTFTDIVAQHPDGYLLTHKLLSENPRQYQDAAVQGIRDLLGLTSEEPLPVNHIAAIKMGTTVATNALLERTGEHTVLVITKGFKDALRIGYQNRPHLFALHIVLPELLYEQVIEVEERYSAQGEELIAVSLETVRKQLQAIYQQGISSVAIVFMHGYRYPHHEQQVATLAREIGFSQISVSHQVSPLPKMISRGETTVVDAYLSPILRRYVHQVAQALGPAKVFFMQSHGGLTDAKLFQGKDAILSGPAGGYVGGIKTSIAAGFHHIINFDMGGTSTDVSHYSGEYERDFETQIAGVRICAPMIKIHTVAAGGGSILHFDGLRFRVGPDSAGANPGPACYRQGGPLTITDCNLLLGKLHGRFFPQVFGDSGQEPLDEEQVKHQFTVLADEISQITGQPHSATQVAEGFIKIAVNNMANAIKKISVQRGYDVTEYTLCCFGGAAGQHACLVAEALGIQTILIHPQAGVLSALGMGLAEIRTLHEQAITAELQESLLPHLETVLQALEQQGRAELQQQDILDAAITCQRKVHLRYAGTDSSLLIEFADAVTMQEKFARAHQQRYGFVRRDNSLVVETVSVEAIGAMNLLHEANLPRFPKPPRFRKPTREANLPRFPKPPRFRKPTHDGPIQPIDMVSMVTGGQCYTTPVYAREDLPIGHHLLGPAIIVEPTSTTVLEPHWQAEITPRFDLVLTRSQAAIGQVSDTLPETKNSAVNPVMLEIFNNLFMSIAEQMGATLANTAYSVNIKERLDFSCALFDQTGQLIANAPHVPVHLGSMGDSVQVVIQSQGDSMQPGDVFVLNNPYHGGTHLPDVTVITPVFLSSQEEAQRGEDNTVLFYVASRGHHADMGGITPGSMPPHSRTLHEEGVVIDVFKLIDQGHLRETEMRALLNSGPYPARNVEQNLADLRAQIAANATGVRELHKMLQHFGLEVVQAYMQHVQDHAEATVRKLLGALRLPQSPVATEENVGTFRYELDQGAVIQVTLTIDRRQRAAIIDFTGTSPQQTNNFNAPVAVCKAAVLYVFRTLVQDDIPLNAGCLKPLHLLIPPGCLLNPTYPAAVVAGNVETSQYITDALYGVLGVMAASQGTMNNVTFGNAQYQYYETLCGGSGAGPGFPGTAAVHTHMTNSRLTDPEVLEWRFPVLLESFAIREHSGGDGHYRGGDGVTRRLRFREAMTASILSSHRHLPPYGMAGGQPGKTGNNWVERADGRKEILAGTATVNMQADDVLVIETPGGGGYGEPCEKEQDSCNFQN